FLLGQQRRGAADDQPHRQQPGEPATEEVKQLAKHGSLSKGTKQRFARMPTPWHGESGRQQPSGCQVDPCDGGSQEYNSAVTGPGGLSGCANSGRHAERDEPGLVTLRVTATPRTGSEPEPGQRLTAAGSTPVACTCPGSVLALSPSATPAILYPL